MSICIFEVFSVTHHCGNHQGRFAIMFRKDWQINSAEENVLLNVSIRHPPPPPPACTLHSKLIIRLKSVNQLLKTTHKIKAKASRPMFYMRTVLISDRER